MTQKLITFGTSNLLSKIDPNSITVGEITVNCSKVKAVKLLGTILDKTLPFRHHATAQAKLEYISLKM